VVNDSLQVIEMFARVNGRRGVNEISVPNLVSSQYFRKFHSQSRVKTRHLNTDQSSLITRSTGVAYL